jgi:hypothetical protein
MNLLKVVVEGGWHIRESEMEEILSLVQLTTDVSGMSLIVGSNDRAIKAVAEGVSTFFLKAMQEFRCSDDLV